MTQPLLQLDRLDAGYGDFQALFGIDLHVAEAETVSIIGANGAGKSTLLKAIVGLVQPMRGDIRYEGTSIATTPAHKRVARGIALVPEGRRIFASLSVEENIVIGGDVGRPGPWTKQRVLEAFPLLTRLLNRSGEGLSGGERQTLAIARALMANPRLLLLDEVSLGLAPIVVRQVYEAVPVIKAQGTTVLIVEQDVNQALAVADRFYCLLEGRIALTGIPGEIPKEQITEAYFGMPRVRWQALMVWTNAVIQGILLGGLYTLFATGLSLSFGVMRLVNLAHGDLAIFAAFMTLSISTTLKINPLVALVIVVPAAFVVGFILQRLIFDRVVGVDPAFQIVATFGLGIVIQNALLERYTADTQGLNVGALKTSTIKINDAIGIGWLPLFTFATAVAVLGSLALFLKRTKLGRAFRATSDDADAARLMGIDIKRVFAVAMGLAIATVALAGVLFGARSSFDPFVGPARLIYAFEAVVIGGLGSLWGTLAGGITLGVSQAIGRKINPQWGELFGHFVFLAVLVLRPTGLFGKVQNAMTMRVVRGTAASRVFAVVAIIGVGVLAFLPSWGSVSLQRKMVELLTLVALAVMWNLLAGFAGVVSVGQQAFVGLGAYSMIALVNVHHQNLYASVPLSGLVAAILSIPIGLITFRLRGSYFAIGTWVLAEAISLIVILQKSIGAGNGVSLKVAGYSLATRQDNSYWFALFVGVGAVLLAYLVLRSRLGLQMQAIRDSEEGARGLGANVYRTRFLVWVLAAFWTGLAGATYYLQQLRVQPAGTGGAFSVVQWTAPIVFIVVIGGIGTIEGPVIGAVLYYFLRDRFKDHQTVYLISMGVLAIAVALWLQGGIWGTIRRKLGADLFPVRRRLVE